MYGSVHIAYRPTRKSALKKPEILFLCTGNSCRSILAEVTFNALAGPAMHAVSAGSHPAGYVHPRSLALCCSERVFLLKGSAASPGMTSPSPPTSSLPSAPVPPERPARRIWDRPSAPTGVWKTLPKLPVAKPKSKPLSTRPTVFYGIALRPCANCPWPN